MPVFVLDGHTLAVVVGAAVVAFGISLALTPVVAWAARRAGIVDRPSEPRKHHQGSVPLLGGIAVFLAFCSTLFLLEALGFFRVPLFPHRALLGVLVGGAVLMLGGYLDDRYTLRPSQQIWFPIAAAVIAVVSGIHMPYVRSPLTGLIIPLDATRMPFFGGSLAWPADPLTVVWLLALMFTTKFLDGVDGLVSGLTAIGGAIMAFVSLQPEVGQPATAALAAAVSGGFLGFLPWNWSPARIFLGESGALFAGYAMGILGVISGSKVATTLLIFGIPLLDVAWVIIQRLFLVHTSPTRGDRRHLHFRLIDAGLSERRAALLFYAIALAFGFIGLVGSTRAKAMAFGLLTLVMVAIVLALLRVLKKKHRPL